MAEFFVSLRDSVFGMFSYGFMVRALVGGLLISLCSALLGVSLVLKRYSMIGDGLSHVSFGAMAVAMAAGIAPLQFAIPIVVLAAFLLLRLNENSRVRGDSAVALVSTSALAIGVAAISSSTGVNTDVYSYMFGSLLGMSKSDVLLCVVFSAIILVMFVLFYNRIFAVTFDENFTRATGTNAGLYDMVIAVLTAVTIVLGMRMMGAMLISSLIIFPVLSALQLCRSYRSVVLVSAALSGVCFFAGIWISYHFDDPYSIPPGAGIVLINLLVFLLFSAVSFVRRHKKSVSGQKAGG